MGRYAFKHEEYKRHIYNSYVILIGVFAGGIGSLAYTYEVLKQDNKQLFSSFWAQLYYFGLFAAG